MALTDRSAPFVRVVVVNFNAGPRLGQCLRALLATEWPMDRFEIVVVDNASVDGSADAVEGLADNVRVLRSPANLGFAGGSNFGMRDLEAVDFVALVNNDAFVTPGWLAPLVDAFDAPDVGAACPKILFDARFSELTVRTETFRPPQDGRDLGVRISGLRVRSVDRWAQTRFVDGVYGEEHSPAEPTFRWTTGQAQVWLAVPEAGAVAAKLRLAAERSKTVTVVSGEVTTELEVGTDPAWYDVPLGAPAFDVINNAGSDLVEPGFGGDRGFWEPDDGRFDAPTEVFAWCGAAVLLSASYLRDAGLFDDDYFLYYEDFDLSWRGRLLGWRYRYVPGSVVRHIHSASTVEGSPLFDHYVQRNRLLTLTKNAPTRFVAERLADYVKESATIARHEIVTPLLRRQPMRIDYARRRLGSSLAFLGHLQQAIRDRRDLGTRRKVGRDELLSWSVRRD